jgi:glycolate dehydrogenase FAD-binding subunit
VTTESVVSAVRESADAREPLRICGHSTWLDAGRPVRTSKTLSLNGDSGITAYVPGDLTLTARAGTPLNEIQRAAKENDQWLPLDPYGSDQGTIGATIATGSAGPLAATFGLPRDLLLGLQFVNGSGEVVRAGGRVVKNVAGFDLSRLIAGSWGTLGVITEVTVRLYARPRSDRTFVVPLDGSIREQTGVIHAIYGALAPFAFQLLSITVSRALGLGDRPTALIRLGGNEAVVESQLRALSQMTRPRELETPIWSTLRELEGSASSVIRISSLPMRLIGTAARILAEEVPGVYTSIDPRRGVMRVVATDDSPNASIDADSPGIDDSSSAEATSAVIYEKLPPELWSRVSPSVVTDALSRGIKKAYDPFNILNPGILGD